MTPIPKILPVRSLKYLEFIRHHPCEVSRKTNGVEAAHQNLGYGRSGGKASDLFTIPLHNSYHAGFGKNKEHDGWLTFWSEFLSLEANIHPRQRKELINGWIAMRCLKYLNEFISNGERF